MTTATASPAGGAVAASAGRPAAAGGGRAGGRAGRRRSEAADDAILTATVELIREQGYGALTMASVIERAAVSSATLYRRWATKHDLVVAALSRVRPESVETDTGSLAGDLRQLMDNIRTAVAEGWIDLAQAIGMDAKRDPDLSAALQERFLEPRLGAMAALLRRARERGELVRSIPPELALSLVIGPLHYHAVLLNKGLTLGVLETACSFAVAGLKAVAGRPD